MDKLNKRVAKRLALDRCWLQDGRWLTVVLAFDIQQLLRAR